jgi:hypothetical protein
MKQFIAKFADKVDGILCGFDRLVTRGELRALYIDTAISPIRAG